MLQVMFFLTPGNTCCPPIFLVEKLTVTYKVRPRREPKTLEPANAINLVKRKLYGSDVIYN